MKVKLKKLVQERAMWCCEYCWAQALFSADSFSIEHIIPVSKNGTDEADNLALSCQACNNHKYISTNAIDPVTGIFVPLYNPRIDIWTEHFLWSDDFTEILGISATGRASVLRLQLNRKGLMNLRKVLANAYLHPPF
jgi:HNH endonuclease